ncbi:unnamed protein product [Prorocentrum cordatum]|uniref:Uncharacterized protein n=1 Tax=Prorocentrum cordatum TaxID=2364126 RepID=A0ABN9R1B7_9DINO|nr:unnamed protein product [Polarella glacialis]
MRERRQWAASLEHTIKHGTFVSVIPPIADTSNDVPHIAPKSAGREGAGEEKRRKREVARARQRWRSKIIFAPLRVADHAWAWHPPAGATPIRKALRVTNAACE